MSLKYFTLDEFNCQVTGENKMEPEFLQKLDRLRAECGFPFVITSGYRHPIEHPIEAAKEVPGTHAQGIAADITSHQCIPKIRHS
jgi:zinc D-Ala-D-Ala carboxypeptidase